MTENDWVYVRAVKESKFHIWDSLFAYSCTKLFVDSIVEFGFDDG